MTHWGDDRNCLFCLHVWEGSKKALKRLPALYTGESLLGAGSALLYCSHYAALVRIITPDEISPQFFFRNPSLWTAFRLKNTIEEHYLHKVSAKARVSSRDARELHTLRFNFFGRIQFFFIQVRIMFHRCMAENCAID